MPHVVEHALTGPEHLRTDDQIKVDEEFFLVTTRTVGRTRVTIETAEGRKFFWPIGSQILAWREEDTPEEKAAKWLDFTTKEIQKKIASAHGDLVAGLVAELTKAAEKGWSDPIGNTLQWKMDDYITAECTNVLWKTVGRLSTERDLDLLDALRLVAADVVKQLAYGHREDRSTSQVSNEIERIKVQAHRKFLDDTRWYIGQVQIVSTGKEVF